MQGIRDKIWLTARIRMEAEKRYATYDLVLHICLFLYSVFLIGLTLFSSYFDAAIPIDSYLIILSVAIVVFSAITYGFGFGKKAVLHRECYLQLDKLCNQEDDSVDILSRYHEVLAAYPNHSDVDFHNLIVNRTLINSRELTDPSGSAISWNLLMVITYIMRKLFFWLLPIALPIAIIFSLQIW